MHDKMDAGQKGCRIRGMQDKRDAGQDGCRTGGCRIRGMQDTRMQARWDVGKESQIIKIILQYVVIVASPCSLFLRVGNLLIGLFLREFAHRFFERFSCFL